MGSATDIIRNRAEGNEPLARLFQIYWQWFPGQAKDQAVKDSVLRGIEEEFGRTEPDPRTGNRRSRLAHHVTQFHDACKAVAYEPVGQQSLGKVLDEYATLAAESDAKRESEAKPRALTAGEQAGNRTYEQYGKPLLALQRALTAGSMTHAEFGKKARELGAANGGLTDEEESYIRRIEELPDALPPRGYPVGPKTVGAALAPALEQVEKAAQDPDPER